MFYYYLCCRLPLKWEKSIYAVNWPGNCGSSTALLLIRLSIGFVLHSIRRIWRLTLMVVTHTDRLEFQMTSGVPPMTTEIAKDANWMVRCWHQRYVGLRIKYTCNAGPRRLASYIHRWYLQHSNAANRPENCETITTFPLIRLASRSTWHGMRRIWLRIRMCKFSAFRRWSQSLQRMQIELSQMVRW